MRGGNAYTLEVSYGFVSFTASVLLLDVKSSSNGSSVAPSSIYRGQWQTVKRKIRRELEVNTELGEEGDRKATHRTQIDGQTLTHKTDST